MESKIMKAPYERSLPPVLSPVLTPFNSDLTPSIPKFVKHCESLLRQDVGLALFGTNSEATSLTVAEKRGLLDTLLDAGLPPEKMMPGTGACALSDTVELTRHAVNSGCAGVLMLPPFYYKGVSDEGLFRAFSYVIDSLGDARLKIFLYHIPPVSGVGVGCDLIERLLKAFPGTIAGIKDSSGDWVNTEAMLRRFGSEDFEIFAGSETFLLRTLRGGGAGCITATGNVNAAAIARLAKTWRDDDADCQQRALDTVRSAFQRFPMIPAMKAAIAMASGDNSWSLVRPPLVELAAEQRSDLQGALDAIGFKVADAERLAERDIAAL
jgi:4-hydroxy-tetrahydrodipicolinate synthase